MDPTGIEPALPGRTSAFTRLATIGGPSLREAYHASRVFVKAARPLRGER